MDDALAKWLNGEITDDELKSAVGDEEAMKYIQIVGEVDRWVPDQADRLFDPRAFTSHPKAKVRTMYPWIAYAAAAVVFLAIASTLWVLMGQSTVTYSSAVGEIREINLPDGVSTVTLASNSEISWDKDDWEEVVASKEMSRKKPLTRKRKVKLRGKALFKINKKGPFSVESASGTVDVLGTIFEVDDFEEGFSVLCFEGQVSARPKTGRRPRVISKREGYRHFNGQWEEKTDLTNDLPEWLQNQTRFTDAPLVQVIRTLERLYGITVDTGDVNVSRRFTGTIPNNKLDVALRIIFTPYKINYVRDGKEITLSTN